MTCIEHLCVMLEKNISSHPKICFAFCVCFFSSETPSLCQRRNISLIIPNTEDGKKRVLIQSELLDGMDCHVVIFYSIIDIQYFHKLFVYKLSLLNDVSET